MQEVVVCVPGGRDSHVEISGHTKTSPKKVDSGETIYFELEPGESITIKVPGAKPPRRKKTAAR